MWCASSSDLQQHWRRRLTVERQCLGCRIDDHVRVRCLCLARALLIELHLDDREIAVRIEKRGVRGKRCLCAQSARGDEDDAIAVGGGGWAPGIFDRVARDSVTP